MIYVCSFIEEAENCNFLSRKLHLCINHYLTIQIYDIYCFTVKWIFLWKNIANMTKTRKYYNHLQFHFHVAAKILNELFVDDRKQFRSKVQLNWVTISDSKDFLFVLRIKRFLCCVKISERSESNNLSLNLSCFIQSYSTYCLLKFPRSQRYINTPFIYYALWWWIILQRKRSSFFNECVCVPHFVFRWIWLMKIVHE